MVGGFGGDAERICKEGGKFEKLVKFLFSRGLDKICRGLGQDAPIGAEITWEFILGEILGLGETLREGRLIGITGEEYSVFCMFWVAGSPEGWGRLSEALGGVLGISRVIIVTGGHCINAAEEFTGKL